MTRRPNFWFDADVTVRMYLDRAPEEYNPDDLALEVIRVVDDAVVPGVMLSCQDVDLGEVRGFWEDLPDPEPTSPDPSQ